jgi:hypothetical protein
VSADIRDNGVHALPPTTVYADRSLSRTSFTLAMLTVAAAIALVLAVVGGYGIISYVISLHAIRLTLGLQPAAVVRMFMSQ